jgi:hypothetical protein
MILDLIMMNFLHLLHLFIILLIFVNDVLAYGYIGHEITAAIAQRFLTPKNDR